MAKTLKLSSDIRALRWGGRIPLLTYNSATFEGRSIYVYFQVNLAFFLLVFSQHAKAENARFNEPRQEEIFCALKWEIHFILPFKLSGFLNLVSEPYKCLITLTIPEVEAITHLHFLISVGQECDEHVNKKDDRHEKISRKQQTSEES